jgi:hypothetical protein
MNVLSPLVHFVTGKGGVGKTVIAQALAKVFAKKNNKTLLVELSEQESEEEGRAAEIKAVEGNLYFLKLYPDQALFEYLTLKIPSKLILEKLLSQNLFRALCSAMPGLADLTRLGKIWYHADRVDHRQRDLFDKIVVDLPSSGFVPRFLSVASVVADAVKIGPLAKEARMIEQFFANPKNACVHLVMTPEEIVLNETLELYREITKIRRSYFGLLFMNRTLTLLNQDVSIFKKRLTKEFGELNMILSLFSERLAQEKHQFSRLGPLARLPMIKINEHFGAVIESQIVDELDSTLSEDFS